METEYYYWKIQPKGWNYCQISVFEPMQRLKMRNNVGKTQSCQTPNNSCSLMHWVHQKHLWSLFWRWLLPRRLQHVPGSWVTPVCKYSFSAHQRGLSTGSYPTLPATLGFAFLRRPLFFSAGTLAVSSSVFGQMELGFTDLCYHPTPLRTERAFWGSTLSLISPVSSPTVSPPWEEIRLGLWPASYFHVRLNKETSCQCWSQHGSYRPSNRPGNAWEVTAVRVWGFVSLRLLV